ncbi:hypothetical protein DID88_003669 [Monilinia fructigena]|uniref:Rhodopsin domain-containing protein n=1 Tax=Monilinia fructigena TaxID=38457 RepID=A0A395ITJ1_9HELO|nr:hypothetical protein DID88_003669 [Monilinia fructigena]
MHHCCCLAISGTEGVQVSQVVTEDWLVMIALLLTIGMGAATIAGVKLHTLAYKTPPTTDPSRLYHVQMSAKIEWAVQLLGILELGLVKLSFAFFFRRIFSISKSNLFTHFNTALIIVLALWTTGYFLTFLFACKGHFAQWWAGIRTGRPICLSDVVFSEGLAISDFIIDMFIIIMPIPMVWRLHMTRSRKVLVTSVFALGTLAVISSIIRLSVFFDAKYAIERGGADNDLLITQIIFWTMIECSLGLIAACLPLLYGLARRSSIESVNSQRSNDSRHPATTSSYTATVLADKNRNGSTTSHTPIVSSNGEPLGLHNIPSHEPEAAHLAIRQGKSWNVEESDDYSGNP